MADFGIDTSSYPKPALPVSPLDTVGKIQSLQSGALTIDQQKLDLYNKHFAIMNNELSNLANDPATTKEEVLTRLHRIGDTFSMPKEVRNQMEAEFAPVPGGTPLGKDGSGNPALSRQLDLVIKRGMDMQQRINSAYGANGSVNNNQSITPSKQYLRGGPIPAGPSIQIQNSPTTADISDTNELSPTYGSKKLLGSQPPQIPAGSLPVEGGFPGQYQPAGAPSLPIAPPPTVIKPAMGAVATPPATAKDDTRLPALPPTAPVPGQPTGPATSMPPNWEEGRANFNKDLSSSKLVQLQLKPLLQAYPLIDKIASGPGTAPIQDILAIGKALGIVPTKAMNDPVVLRQEVEKKLKQFIGNSPIAGRSDAAQFLTEGGSPNLTQLNPALKQLIHDQVVQSRIAAAVPNSFYNLDTEGKKRLRQDYHQYNEFAANFPRVVDEKAFGLDLMPPKERNALLKKMDDQLTSKDKDERTAAQRFLHSVEVAHDLGYITE